MKSTLIPAPEAKPEVKYPRLMESKSSGLVVLFHDATSGQVMRPSELWTVGKYSAHWDAKNFTPLPPGTKIVLEQE